MALVLPVAQLPDQYHDSIMTLVETDQAQDAFEFGEIMHIRPFPDGRPMLRAMQADNRLVKVATDAVMMTPTTNDTVLLANLNTLIAEQKNCTIDDLCTFVSGAPTGVKEVKEATPAVDSDIPAPVRAQATSDSVLTDKDLAKSYRSQADAMYKEAARLRKEAEDLDPTVKKVKKVEETADA
jgi:DNA repair ATPase RecN